MKSIIQMWDIVHYKTESVVVLLVHPVLLGESSRHYRLLSKIIAVFYCIFHQSIVCKYYMQTEQKIHHITIESVFGSWRIGTKTIWSFVWSHLSANFYRNNSDWNRFEIGRTQSRLVYLFEYQYLVRWIIENISWKRFFSVNHSSLQK